MKLKRYNDINENNNHDDLNGGISLEEYDDILKFIQKLKERTKNGIISDEDKIISEILYMVIEERNKLDFNSYYHNRLINIKNKYNKKGIGTTEFINLVWWLQNKYKWDYVKTEGPNKVKFEWNDRKDVFWLNDNMTIKGFIPEELRNDLIKKGISLENN